ncbi:MAG: hypothetical protein JO168_10885 [Solirubrobacterales bacterium]|nr:hypothetical protein [Solirubrobacterales bacterium]
MSTPYNPNIDFEVSRGTGLHLQINGRAVDDAYGAIVMADSRHCVRSLLPCASTYACEARPARPRSTWLA